MKKVQVDLDREAIDLANSEGERRKAKQVYRDACYHWRAYKRAEHQKARAKFFKTLAAMEVCILGVLLSVVALLSGWIGPEAAVVLLIVFAAGGGTVGRRLQEGQWYDYE